MGQLYLGTCSWKYPSWAGLVYSERKPDNYLAEYALKYNSVEVDQWFWSLGKNGVTLPRREVSSEYDASTPDDFRFTIKCPNSITLTHYYSSDDRQPESNPHFLDSDLFYRFIDALAPIVRKTLLFIFQFEYLNKKKVPSKQAFFDKLVKFLDILPRDLPYAVEIRNPKWMDAIWFDLLQTHHVAPVLLQGYWMEDVTLVLDHHVAKMGDTICIRLHGENREDMEEKTGGNWDRIIHPRDNEIERIANLLKVQYRIGKQIIVNFNNHYEGSAPLTITKFQKYFLSI